MWVHEVSRVFYDRLINDDDREWFKELVADILGRIFRSRWGKDDVFDANKVLYGDLLKIDADVKDYEEIKDISKLIKVLDGKLEDYNMDFN